MRVLRVDPIEYLIVPRFLAGVIMMPVVFIVDVFCRASLCGLCCKLDCGAQPVKLCGFTLARIVCPRYYDCYAEIRLFWRHNCFNQLFFRVFNEGRSQRSRNVYNQSSCMVFSCNSNLGLYLCCDVLFMMFKRARGKKLTGF